MFVRRGEDFLPFVELKKLEGLYARETNVKAKIRLQCAVLRKKGERQPFIASVTGKPVTTVSGILRRFEERGVKGAYAIKQTGQPKKLSMAQHMKLKRIVLKSPLRAGFPFTVWTTKMVQYLIWKRFKVEYVLMQVHRLLKRMKLSLQKARPEHLKADKEAQKQFIKNLSEELKDLGVVDIRSYFWTKAPST
jgi:transposase